MYVRVAKVACRAKGLQVPENRSAIFASRNDVINVELNAGHECRARASGPSSDGSGRLMRRASLRPASAARFLTRRLHAVVVCRLRTPLNGTIGLLPGQVLVLELGATVGAVGGVLNRRLTEVNVEAIRQNEAVQTQCHLVLMVLVVGDTQLFA